MIALIIGSLSSVSSCKDSDEDLRRDFKQEQLTLSQDFQNKLNHLRDSFATVTLRCKIKCDSAFNALKNEKVDTATYNQHLRDYAKLLAEFNKYKEAQNKLDSIINTPSTGILARLLKIEEMLGIDKGFTLTLPEVHSLAKQAYDKADSLAKVTHITDSLLKVEINLRQAQIDSVRKEAAANLDSARKYTDTAIAGLKVTLNTRIDSLKNAILPRLDSLELQYTELEKRVAKNEKDIDSLAQKLSALENRVENMVTSVIVQAVENPIFGSFALPVNVQSNILLAYYGNCEMAQISFPHSPLNNEYNGVRVITAEDWARIGAVKGQSYTANKGDIMTTGKAGRVYLTVNPTNVDFSQEGKNISLVNSRDEVSGIELSKLKTSDKLLTFGFTYNTRANNGFYEAEATLNTDKIDEVKVNIDPQLKSSLSAALRDHTKSDFVKLIKVIYDQFNGILPANAVKAQWSVDATDYAVYSNYNVAATAFKPLSYKFLYGHETSHKFPTINPIELPEINIKDYINFDDLHMPQITIDKENIKFKLNISDITIDNLSQIQITVDMPTDFKIVTDPITGENKVTYTTKPEVYTVSEQDMKRLADELAKAIGDSISGDVETAVNQVVDDIVKEIQRAMEEALNGQDGLLTQIKDKLDNLNQTLADKIRDNFGAYVDRLNNYIGKINSLTNRLNNIIKDPNHYLQVTMLYEFNGEYHQLSNNKYVPTYVKLAGGDAMELFPTSYTAEIAAPSFKKYVAVTNVYDANGNSNQTLIDNANSQQFMNEVVDGGRLSIALPLPAAAAGYTYEIAYSALDYQGVTSTQKFYITVVK